MGRRMATLRQDRAIFLQYGGMLADSYEREARVRWSQPSGESIMFRIAPLFWSAVHIGVVGVTTWLVVASDLLDSAPLFFIH